jgi:trehalose utilization protein
MGSPCSLKWREAGERERVWAINRGHPIAQGIGEAIEIDETEMYGEPFAVPEPLETVFVSWYQGGEVFRSGLTYQRGAGKIFYFSPGHETYPIYHNQGVRQVLRNAVHWAHNPAPAWTAIQNAPNVPVGSAKEKIVQKGARLHADGDKGLR